MAEIILKNVAWLGENIFFEPNDLFLENGGNSMMFLNGVVIWKTQMEKTRLILEYEVNDLNGAL